MFQFYPLRPIRVPETGDSDGGSKLTLGESYKFFIVIELSLIYLM